MTYEKELAKRKKVKNEYIKSMNLYPLEDHSNIFVDVEKARVISFHGKTPRFLVGSKGTTGYRAFSLRPDSSKEFKCYGLHEIVYAAKNKKKLKSWRTEGKVIHHIDNDHEGNNHWSNLCEMDEKEHQKLKKNRSESARRISDDEVRQMRAEYSISNLSKTKFAMNNAEKYKVSVVYLINIVSNKVRKNI